MQLEHARLHAACVTRNGSYAVRWRAERSETHAGQLELRDGSFRLEGGALRGSGSVETIRYADLAGVRMARADERIGARPTILVDRRWSALPLAIASLEGLGAVRELFERLSTEVARIVLPLSGVPGA